MAKPRALLVDDDPSIVHVLELNLRFAGFTSDHAYRGEEAVERAATEAPDVVVMDVGIPGFDGFETARLIRSLPGLGAVPLIFLTGRVLPEPPEGLEDARVLTKPFDLDELVAVVRAAVADGSEPDGSTGDVGASGGSLPAGDAAGGESHG